MGTEVSDDNIVDRAEVLTPKLVRGYTEKLVETGRGEYNLGTILVKSKHPLDQCLKRGIIEQEHHDSGKRLMTIRDCAFSKAAGRSYNAAGGGESEIDAATLYTNLWKHMPKPVRGYTDATALVKLLCFAEPDISGDFFKEADYAFLYGLAPKIQNAFELLDNAVQETRKEIKARMERASKGPDQ